MKERPRVGVGVIIVRGEKVLFGLRTGPHGKGMWSLPGGHLEHGESPEKCAVRELEEETGLRVSVEDIDRGPYTNDFFEESGKHYITLFMIARLDFGEPCVREPEKCER